MAKCEKFVILDNVQFTKDKFFHRTKIKTPQGSMWLTIPVHYKFSEKPNINSILIDNHTNWRRKHWRAIVTNYGKARFFKDYIDGFEQIFQKEWQRLSDLNTYIIRYIAHLLKIEVDFVIASELDVHGKSTDLLIGICKRLNASRYISGPSGRKYLEEKKFEQEGIELIYHDFVHPVYPQLYGDFVPYLSMIDLIFNHGSKSIDILMHSC